MMRTMLESLTADKGGTGRKTLRKELESIFTVEPLEKFHKKTYFFTCMLNFSGEFNVRCRELLRMLCAESQKDITRTKLLCLVHYRRYYQICWYILLLYLVRNCTRVCIRTRNEAKIVKRLNRIPKLANYSI